MKPPVVAPARTFPSAQEDAVNETVTPNARYDGPESSYRLAFTDTDFLLREELRPVRVQLELLKPRAGAGRARRREDRRHLRQRPHPGAGGRGGASSRQRARRRRQALKLAETRAAMSRFYEEARRFSAIVTRRSATLEQPLYVVTGGGPGIMEAGNRGAFEAGGKSIGLNIVLSHEQVPNRFITPELCFQFHYFALRKMHFLMRAVALVCFPGGFGTLDELFEVLTLVQTGKSRMRPILLFGREFWTRLIHFDVLVETGMIAAGGRAPVPLRRDRRGSLGRACGAYGSTCPTRHGSRDARPPQEPP